MDILLIILGAIFMLIGIAGCILPILPGPPISYVGLLILHFTTEVDFSNQFLIAWALVTIAVSVADYFIPIWGTKKFGGSKYGVWGSLIGMISGFLWPPVGIIAGTFIGAVVGEWLGGKKEMAIKAGFGSFIGFMGGIVLKLAASGIMLFYFVKALL